MKFQDCEVKNVRQDGRDFLCFKITAKREDYSDAEYRLLKDKEVNKETVDIDINDAQATKIPEVNQGEVTN